MSTINYDQAFALVNQRIKSNDPEYQYCGYGIGSEIVTESTQEIKNGWLFFYQSKEEIDANKYVDIKGTNEEGDLSIKDNANILLGGGPIYITYSGSIYQLGSMWEYEIEEIDLKNS